MEWKSKYIKKLNGSVTCGCKYHKQWVRKNCGVVREPYYFVAFTKIFEIALRLRERHVLIWESLGILNVLDILTIK